VRTSIWSFGRLRHLHPALKELNYVNPHTGTHKAWNRAFRRFRNTYLKNYTNYPKGLYDYWLGHAGEDRSDLYDKIREDVPFRKMWAKKADSASNCPELYRVYRKKRINRKPLKLRNRLNVRERRLVGERGFEPPTPWSRTRCSTRLSHSPTRLRSR
jgi:hypothetical protein